MEAERSRLAARKRPTRAEIEPAALALLQRHGAAIMAAARRFAATPEDAEDAYQRGVEILLTKAPTTAEEELVPWLRTVVKHEAWALRRQRDRAVPVSDDGQVPEPPTDIALTHDQAERLDRLRLGAEAMRQLKPQEIRALLLKAEGYSYKQIQEITGWTYTTVNRCLTEGRKAFLERVAGIEAGGECERLAPLLSKLVDGEATGDDLRTLRPHIRTCLTCRAALREYRSAPATAAALVPAAALVSHPRPGLLDTPARLLETLAGWSQKVHATVEMASAQKVAAVAASTAALASGGVATVEHVAKEKEPPRVAEVRKEPRGRPLPPAPVAAALPATIASTRTASPAPRHRRVSRPTRTERREREARQIERATPPTQREFDPAWAASEPTPVSEPPATTASTASSPSEPPPRTSAPSGGGAEEFAP